jgi:hypothetical protein
VNHYRGWRSTKLHLALITMGLLTIVYARAGYPAAEFSTFAMGLIAAAGIFSGAAVMAGKNPPPPPPAS